MAKIHARLSVEIEVTEEQLRQIYYKIGKRNPGFDADDIDVNKLPDGIDLKNAKACDWDEGGYIPGSWLEFDAVEAGIVKAEEVGI